MTLTVPQAGVVAGRSASVEIDAPDTGGIIAAFGQRMSELGQKVKAERDDLRFRRDQMDMARDFALANQQSQQMTDPATIGQAFEQSMADLQAKYLDRDDLSPEMKERVGLLFQDYRNRHEIAVGDHAIAMTQSQRQALWVEMESQILADAASADPVTFVLHLDMGANEIDADLARGYITPAEAATRKQALRHQAFANRANQQIIDDPESFLADMEDGAYDDLGGKKATFEMKAKGQIASNAKLAEAEQKKADTEFVQDATKLLRDGIGVFGKGLAFERADVATEILNDPRLAGSDEARQYAQAQLLHETMPTFARSPLAEKEAALAEAKSSPKDKPFEAEVIAAMEASIKTHRDAIKADPLGFAEEIGLKGAASPLPEPVASAPEIAQALRGRLSTLDALAATGLTSDPKRKKDKAPLFRPEEKAAYAELVSPDAAPADRLKIATAIATLPAETAEAAARELGGDQVFQMVTSGVAAGAYSATFSRQIFEGQRVIARGDVKLPGATEMRQSYFEDFGALFSDGTQGSGIDESRERDLVLTTAAAVYAYRIRQSGKAADGFDEDVYKQALHEVMGGTGSYDSADARGGMQSVQTPDAGSYKIMLPPGISAAEFKTAYDNMIPQFEVTGLPDAETTMPVLPDADWKAVTLQGRTPKEPINRETLRRTRFVAVQGGMYRMEVMDQRTGEMVSISDAGGMPLVIDIERFIDHFGGRE